MDRPTTAITPAEAIADGGAAIEWLTRTWCWLRGRMRCWLLTLRRRRAQRKISKESVSACNALNLSTRRSGGREWVLFCSLRASLSHTLTRMLRFRKPVDIMPRFVLVPGERETGHLANNSTPSHCLSTKRCASWAGLSALSWPLLRLAPVDQQNLGRKSIAVSPTRAQRRCSWPVCVRT